MAKNAQILYTDNFKLFKIALINGKNVVTNAKSDKFYPILDENQT